MADTVGPVEATSGSERTGASRREVRRNRLRKIYQSQVEPTDMQVDINEVVSDIGHIAADTRRTWRRMSEINLVALSESSTRDDLDDLEFLINRALGELNAIKNIVSLAKHLS